MNPKTSHKFKAFMIMMVAIVMFAGSVITPPQARTAYAGPVQSADDTAKIDAYVQSMLDKLQIPGAAVGIIRGDQVVYLKGYGISGSDQQPITPQTPFIIGSSTKSFTALATMQLVEQGKIDLDAPVRRYLPQFELADPEAPGQITVKNLLTQVSGFSTYHGRIAFSNHFASIDELLDNQKKTPLTEPVGAKYQYSNLNFDILGGIIEAVTNEPYSEYIQKHIFTPLEMKNSFTSTLEAKQKGLATGYQPIFGYMTPMKQPDNPAMLASAYLISSAEDMANYLIAQLNEGKFKDIMVASPASISQMHEPFAEDSSINGYYGMGWEVIGDNIQHAGDIESFHSDMLLNGDTGIVVLINAHDYLVRGYKFNQIAYGILEIMHGQEPRQDGGGNLTRTNVIIDLICAALVVLTGWAIYNLFRWNRKFKHTPLRITVFVAWLLVFNLIVPAGILILLGNYVTPWGMVFSFLPGIGHLAFILCVLWLCIGLVKIILFVCSLMSHKKMNGFATAGSVPRLQH
ncbi:class A beta-lactamase-related serine hydrolase [Paenibacillus oralis]|uniref:Class A beta-lactamase-related serine hydrolase n=1 Tax=Paenibacillus oralis TaxID=2490856 RepID=A0A3P3TV68_9BACL|nr:serine hydrolase domain-containing protein [Paenibacillus oralis]RRJ61644.1 class A beta-lactamase-related serine hydrolase [Paenibacillus oralis]